MDPACSRLTVLGVKRVSNEEAAQLLAQGARYVDVRTPEEFDGGHVPGALNLPLRLNSPTGMVDNPEFLAVAERLLRKAEPLLVGCRSGARSLAAVRLLGEAGFTALHDVTAGFSGGRDAFGRPLSGWEQEGREVERGTPTEQSYEQLRRAAAQ